MRRRQTPCARWRRLRAYDRRCSSLWHLGSDVPLTSTSMARFRAWYRAMTYRMAAGDHTRVECVDLRKTFTVNWSATASSLLTAMLAAIGGRVFRDARAHDAAPRTST